MYSESSLSETGADWKCSRHFAGSRCERPQGLAIGRERRKSSDFNGQESLLLVQRKSEQAMLTPLTPIRRRSPCETAQDSKHLQQLEYLADIVTVSNSKPPGMEQLILRSL